MTPLMIDLQSACMLIHVQLFFDPVDCSPLGFSAHGIFPSKNTGEGCRSLLWGIFATQGLNPCLLH